MRVLRHVLFAVLFCFLTHITFAQADFIDSSSKPLVFAPGIISTPYTEWATSFTPAGNTVYFSHGAIYCTICFSKKTHSEWARPQVVNFSGFWRDTDPFITPDVSKMFFSSNRPVDAMQKTPERAYQIWYTDYISEDHWSEPHSLDSPVNLQGINSASPSISSDGTLYFCSVNRDGHPGWTSFSASWNGIRFEKPNLLHIEGVITMMDPFISPDGKYLLFVSGNDIFVSYKNDQDWSKAIKLPGSVNNGNANQSPAVSRDGKLLYYSSARDRGFYQRNTEGKPLNYDELIKEMQSPFNGGFNILMIPVKLK